MSKLIGVEKPPLSIPTHVARQAVADFRAKKVADRVAQRQGMYPPLTQEQIDDPWLGEYVPNPEDLPTPERYWVLVKQVLIRDKVGSILLSDQSEHDQVWTHGLAMIIKYGPSCYTGPVFKAMGLGPEDKPPVGSIMMVNAKVANGDRFKFDGEDFFNVPDDSFRNRVPRHSAHRVSFTI